MAVITAGALALALSGHSRAASHGGPLPSQNAGAEASTRNLAAAWVASQVSRAAIVSCDPLMCQALRSHGVPVSDLSQISRDTISPLHSDIIVATATVRAQFGNLLSSVYAPGILGSFGSGELRIDIRQIAPHGPAAYRSQLNADLLARKASGATVLHFAQIAVSPTARKQLLAGQADSRLLVVILGMASVRPVYLVGFSGSSPGADAAMPLRFAEVAQTAQTQHAAGRSVTPSFVRAMVTFLRTQQAPYVPASTRTVRTAAGQLVLRIEFTAPSPFGLLGPHSP